MMKSKLMHACVDGQMVPWTQDGLGAMTQAHDHWPVELKRLSLTVKIPKMLTSLYLIWQD